MHAVVFSLAANFPRPQSVHFVLVPFEDCPKRPVAQLSQVVLNDILAELLELLKNTVAANSPASHLRTSHASASEDLPVKVPTRPAAHFSLHAVASEVWPVELPKRATGHPMPVHAFASDVCPVAVA
tara:strand:+ start:2823 stop:3203 length:381 start_codon:yes stop_codon:yes gene_type:complete